MPYIKLLTVLAGLALLTACAGGVTVNPTLNTNGNGVGGDGPCVTNPFGTTCTNATETQELVFCRDEGKTTDTKTDDCAPTVRLVCTANVFDTLCTAPTQQEAEAYCGDASKTTDTKTNDCADTIKTACVDFFHSLCTAEVYVQQRKDFNDMCINQEGKTPQICEAEALARTCDADEFVTGCVAQKYVDERRMTCMGEKTSMRCIPTVELICGTNGNSLDNFCADIPAYYPAQKLACATGQDDRGETACQPTIARICTNGDIFDDFCTGLPTTNDDRQMACESGMPKRTDDDCKPTIARICTNGDIFDDFCTGLTGIDTMRITDCITVANTEDMKCNTILSDTDRNTAVTACLTNPFTDDCASNTDFMTYAGDARTNRVSFCGMMGNESKAPCTALTTCQDNPFHASCGAYFESAKAPHCETNNDVADCPNVTFGDWVDSFTPAPATTPTTGTPKNEFLQTTGATIATGDLTAQGGGAITPDSLTLNANDGVAFFQGYSGNSGTEYAGIFDTTDLGVPFTEDAPSAKWKGQFQAVGAGSFPIKTDFLLEVTFGMDVNVPGSVGSIDAFVSAGSTFHYLIEGTFNGTGVIKGTVSSGLFTGDDQNTPTNALEGGVLTGLIGAEGAVGAFYTNAMLTSGASGGFIAAPTAPDTEPLVVNHGDWLRDFFKPPPATRAASSAGTDTFGGFLNLASDVRAISETGFEANSVIKGTLTLDGDGTDGMHGVTYLGGGDANNNRQAFGAVLPTTNLGAPLVSPPTTTTWPGKYYNITFGNAQVIPFVIDFSGKSITATHTDAAMATTNFALRFIPATGVITGTVTRSGTATARGLIGTNGLVGVYVDTTEGRSTGDSVLFGGFIADNPDN